MVYIGGNPCGRGKKLSKAFIDALQILILSEGFQGKVSISVFFNCKIMITVSIFNQITEEEVSLHLNNENYVELVDYSGNEQLGEFEINELYFAVKALKEEYDEDRKANNERA